MNYIVHAYRIMRDLAKYIYDWRNINEIERAVSKYGCATWTNNLRVEYGSSRVVIVGPDFAVKWDYDINSTFHIGGCEDELMMYEYARRVNKDYLFARVSCIYINGLFLYVMPRVRIFGSSLCNYLEENEFSWLAKTVSDLHCYNWGLLHGKPVLIDYACYNKYNIKSPS